MELIVATLTPFTAGGGLDLEALSAHARWLAAAGVSALAPAGTTGELLYLSTEERRAAHAATLAAAGGCAVIPCVWDPGFGRSAALARAAEADGAAAVFLPPPIYHRVSELDVLRWYGAVREAVSIPVWAYHHPATRNPLDAALLGRLFEEVGLDGMKDSSGDPERIRDLAGRWPGRIRIGGDPLLARMDTLGPVAGHVSGLANLLPGLARAVLDGADGGAWLAACAAVKAAGSSVPTMKRALGFGLRAPIEGGVVPEGLPPIGFTR
jgi:4-hydroxy-tetrahydrodipicolinate synthase